MSERLKDNCYTPSKATRMAKKLRVKFTPNGLIFPDMDGIDLDGRMVLYEWHEPMQKKWVGHDYATYY